MQDRCYNKSCNVYSSYGGSGVTMCDEWHDKYEGFYNFYNWSISNGFTPELSIDRINPYGNYSPSNCRWANDYLQSINKRSSVIVKIADRLISLKDYCKEHNYSYLSVRKRIVKYNWTLNRSVNIPIGMSHVTADNKFPNNFLTELPDIEIINNNKYKLDESSPSEVKQPEIKMEESPESTRCKNLFNLFRGRYSM